jgi:hypothetical protein
MGIISGVAKLGKSAISFYKKATAPADALKASGKLTTLTFPDITRASPVSSTGAKIAKSVGSFAVSALKKAGSFIITKPKTALVTAIAVPTAVGVLTSSPTAREFAKETLSPSENIKRGKALGEVIEGKRKITKKDIVTAGKALGIGAIVAGGMYGADYLLNKDDENKGDGGALPSGSPIASASPQTALTKEVSKTPSTTTRKRRKSQVRETPTIVNNIRIDDRDIYSSNGIRKYTKRKIYKGGHSQ